MEQVPILLEIDQDSLGLSPTDVSQFIRLDQCERYLRLRLHERSCGSRFMREYGVQPQAIPPLLTRSGRSFEEQVESEIRAHGPVIDLAEAVGEAGDRGPDNARVVAVARDLPAGERFVLFQARLHVTVDGWRLSGDADLLRLERSHDGALHLLIVDIKSTAGVKVEHRLQVAFYHAMAARLFEQEGVECAVMGTGILYRYREAPGSPPADEADAARRETEREAARRLFGAEALLEIVSAPDAYLDSVRDLVTGPGSLSRRLVAAPFETVPFHLTYKCDGCLYNEFCLKWSAERDDLSLLPHLSSGEKSALQRAGVRTVQELAVLKEFPEAPAGERAPTDLVPAPGKEALCRRVATTWPVGHRLDELVHRARRYRKWKKTPLEALDVIPSKGYGSLPYCDAAHNPNLVRIFIDAQHDYLHDRIAMLGALVVACEGGKPKERRSIVHLADGQPDSAEAERRLLARWVRDLLRAVVESAAPDAEGKARAPLHLIFYDSFEQRLLLAGLSRHLTSLLGAAPALYDFMTQLAAFDSPIATFLDQEIRELKNYPMVCQSLQAVAAFLKFDWNTPEPFTKIFRERLFDEWGRLQAEGEEPRWYTGRARFTSQIPLEYAYAAWGELEAPAGGRDDYAAYRAVTPELLRRFQARRLEAMEHITADFRGNHLTEKRPFDLPDLAAYTDTARSLAHALDEFVMIERHVDLHQWKMIRHAPPERRALVGETLLVRYVEEDQEPGIAEANRENERRRRLREQYEAASQAENPDTSKAKLSKEQREETRWTSDGLRVRLRLETAGIDGDLEQILALLTLQVGDRFVLNARWTTDTRLPEAERVEFMPTPKQMLYGQRAAFVGLQVERDGQGQAVGGWVEVELQDGRGGEWSRGFAFSTYPLRTLMPGALYTLDRCPNDWSGYFNAVVTGALRDLPDDERAGRNALYDRIAAPSTAAVDWPPAAAEAQRRFLAGLDALHEAGALHGFEESKREYISAHGDAPVLLVQGPPGTGKSYSTGFALFARMQGALAAGRPFRALLSCKTHAAIDVLLANVLEAQQRLRRIQQEHPDLFARYFDARLLEVPLYRVAPRDPVPDGVIELPKDREKKEKGERKNADRLAGEEYCVAAATPGAIYGIIKARWEKELFGHGFCDCLVLDEASQMNLPEAILAALPLRSDAPLIVVGDHRQMPPIVKHDWDSEPRRTFQEYQAYQSLFLTLLPLNPPTIRFAESFRLHQDMAEFLRREIYHQDGIPYHSRKNAVLESLPHDDPFLAAVLAPEHPLVVVVHDEAASQTRNPFEQALITPILAALADPAAYNLGADKGLGVVVPHRAQRAAVQSAFPCLCVVDETTGSVKFSAVDTVERFQGGERTVILVSATESDREFVLASSKFLLDPRRLTVAMSRAKQKLVLVASRSVFTLFSPDEQTFAHSQLWKNLLRRTCTVSLWHGEREGMRVEVWGNDEQIVGSVIRQLSGSAQGTSDG